MSLMDRVQSLPDVLRWRIARYIQHPAAEIVETAYDEMTININCPKCECESCRMIRCRHVMNCTCSIPHPFQDYYTHTCWCEDDIEAENDARKTEAWLSAWNDINTRKICGLRKRPLRASHNNHKVNYIEFLEGGITPTYDGFIATCKPPRYRTPIRVKFTKAI